MSDERWQKVEQLKKRMSAEQIGAAGALFADFINGAPITWAKVLELVEGVQVVQEVRVIDDPRTAALKVLGLGPEAGDFEIRLRYKRLAFENHPDRGGSEEVMRGLNKAKEVLGI
jgi:hypothetical protein